MGYFHDYGTTSRRAKKIEITKENTRSYRCMDCKHQFYMGKLQARRAKRPTCDRCGGFGAETEASVYRHIHKFTDRQKERNERLANQKKELRCEECDKKFRAPAAMKIHREEAHDVFETPNQVDIFTALKIHKENQ